jgi:hypothetical protein
MIKRGLVMRQVYFDTKDQIFKMLYAKDGKLVQRMLPFGFNRYEMYLSEISPKVYEK